MNLVNDIFLCTTEKKCNELLVQFQQKLDQLPLNLVAIPTIEVSPEENSIDFIGRLQKLHCIDFILFTSQNAVFFFFQKLQKLKKTNLLYQKKYIVIGRQTAKKLQELLPSAKYILYPKESTTEGLMNFVTQQNIQKSSFWFVCSNLTDQRFTNYIHQNGGQCWQDIIYKNNFPKKHIAFLKNYFSLNIPRWAIFSSPSSFSNLADTLQEKIKVLQETKIVAIGKTTATIIQQKKLPVYAIANLGLHSIIENIITER